MALEEVFAELEALKPAFQFEKNDMQNIANELAGRMNATIKNQLPECGKWESAKMVLDAAFDASNIEFNTKYLKLQDILKARGFDESGSKNIGNYTIHVCGFEDGISFDIRRTGKFDLHKTHLLIKKEFLKVLLPITYTFKFDDPENADEDGMNSHYTADLLTDKNKIKTLIKAAKVKYINDKLHDETNVEVIKLEEFKKYLDEETVSRTAKKERAVQLMNDCKLKFSLSELRRKNFAREVYKKLEARLMSGKSNILENEIEKKALENINLEYMWRFGGFNVYAHKKTMWQNINYPVQTSYEVVLANMKILAPYFEKIYEDIDAVMSNPAKPTTS